MKRKYISYLLLILILLVIGGILAAGLIEKKPEPVKVEKEIKYEKH